VAFKPVPTRVDYVRLEHGIQSWWDEHDTPRKYLHRNENADKRWSFVDGPITANNPMGVHHAWGRSYKDLYQRLKTMQGFKQRYQNGFDCQGLWIEVEVEKEKGFTSKKDIETFGIADFVEACKERVVRFSGIQTEQSKRLAYWMDWDGSYYTNSDENNYTIWAFLKKCWERGYVYKGKDAMPWCPRCGTGISQHEIVTEGYRELTHPSVYLKFPLLSKTAENGPSESLLVWTTTPWTLAANVAAAVHPDLTYLKVRQRDEVFYVSRGALAAAVRGEHEVVGEVKGADLVGREYRGPFDELPAQEGVVHRVIAWDEVSDAEGTGIVHIAPGAGAEDFALSRKHGLEVIAPLDENGVYLAEGFGFLSGQHAYDVPQVIFDSLREKGLLHRTQDYTHRYPVCWRCGSELVFRLVDEWFISMDQLRHQIMDVTRKARWIPEFGLARELDWLKNMHDWMISKKRYYGLALPIFECQECGDFEVVGSETELEERAVEGWDEFEGHSPHRPYIDSVRVACRRCGAKVPRIKDVGNPWLDAGIVPFSTLGFRHDRAYWEQWYPADWVSESFPGQFRNWFYSLLAMATVMTEGTVHEGEPPFKELFSYALLRDEKGEEMHKSKGNAIWFEDAAERMGVDVMRWMFFRHPPANNLNFGWHGGDEIKRGFLSTLWNTYSFFVTYANIDGWRPAAGRAGAKDRQERPELDRWALSELNRLVQDVTRYLEDYDSAAATRQVEEFVEGLSNWYVRRSRRRFWKSEDDADKRSAYETLWTCLETLMRLLAPMLPFLAEDMYQNLVRSWDETAPESVHLADWPVADATLIDRQLSEDVRIVRFAATLAHSARNAARVKVRQPLREVVFVGFARAEEEAIRRQAEVLLDEINVKSLRFDMDKDRTTFIGWGYHLHPKRQSSLRSRLGNDGFSEVNNLLRRQGAHVERLGAGRVRVGDHELEEEDIYVQFTNKPDFVTAGLDSSLNWREFETATVVLTIDSRLRAEGLARELVRRIQEMRKNAQFDISDRIALSYETDDPELDSVIRSEDWGQYIRQETLAEAIDLAPPPEGAYSEDHSVDGKKVRLAVRRA
jgi:isoleucyl-tRNA synthetase